MKGFVARTVRAALVAVLGVTALAASAQAKGAQANRPTGLNVYSVDGSQGKAQRLLAQEGFDLTESGKRNGRRQIVATAQRAQRLEKLGLDPELESRSSVANVGPDGSYDVYRPYYDHTYVGTVGGIPGGTPRQTLYEEF